MLFLLYLGVSLFFNFNLLLFHFKYFVLDLFKLGIGLLLVPHELPSMLVVKSLEFLDLSHECLVFILVSILDFFQQPFNL